MDAPNIPFFNLNNILKTLKPKHKSKQKKVSLAVNRVFVNFRDYNVKGTDKTIYVYYVRC